MSPRDRSGRAAGASRLVTIVRGIGSALLLALVMAGIPWVLVRIGAFPTSVPAPASLWQAAIGPDLSGRAAFTVMAALVWIGWAGFSLSVLREVGAAIRSRGRGPARQVRGLTVPGRPAAYLVTAIVAMFVAAPLLAAAAPPAAAAGHDSPGPSGGPTVATAVLHPGSSSPPARASNASASTTSPSTPHPAGSRAGGPAAAPAAHATPAAVHAPAGNTQHSQYTVRRHDTLWSIADRQLGDPLRYREIAALNPQVGHDFIVHTGQVLTLPASGASATAGGKETASHAAEHVTVEKGDTLSGIAAGHQVRDWHTVWKANKGKTELGGKRFTDPNHIEVGWDITLPGTTSTPAAMSATPAPNPASEATTPAPAVSPPAPARADTSTSNPGAVTSGPAAAGQACVVTAPEQRHGPELDQAGTGQRTATDAPSAPSGSAPASPDGSSNVQHEGGGSVSAVAPALGRVAAGGVVLTAVVFGLLTIVRRQQFRDRRPGRTIASTPSDLAPIEHAVVTSGAPAAADIARLDQVLRRVAATDVDTLHVAAVQLTAGDITLHLATPAVLPTSWRQRDGEELVWTFPAATPTDDAGVDPDEVDAIAPYPTLVNIGADATSSWLLNLEQTGALVLTGDQDRCLRLARVMAAQLGMNPWGEAINVTLLGFGEELVDTAPGRLRHATLEESTDVLSAAVAEAVRTADFADKHHVAVVEGRRRAVADEAWAPQVILATSAAGRHGVDPGSTADGGVDSQGSALLGQLLELLHARDGATGAAVVVIDDRGDGAGAPRHEAATSPDGATVAQLSADGMLTLLGVGLTVVAGGWDEDTSRGVARMLAHARTASDEKIPDATGGQPWQAFSDAAGALRAELVEPRSTPDVHDSTRPSGACTLPLADEVYLEAGATTQADLEILAPSVPVEVREQVEQIDPGLDEDVAAWFDDANRRSKLAVLGPIALRTVRRAKSRPAYWAELAAYLAYRPHGASADEIATAFSLTAGSTRSYLTRLRELLGDDPDTGQPYLPNADESPAKKTRGVNIYKLGAVLVDADLFRRLRLRGQARGEAGIEDYVTALRLVTGQPFSQMRDGGGAWFIGGDRIDQHLTVAIVDVAHLVTTRALAAEDTDTGRAATDIARLAAPDAEGPRLDSAAVDRAEGRTDEARRTLLDDVCNRSDDGEPPMELNPRTKQILAHHRDWLSRAS